MATYSTTRWWSKWEVVKIVMLYFGDIEPFLVQNDDIGPATRPKLLAFFSDLQKQALLQLEIAATVDWGEPFVKACYFLEGDGPLTVDCYEKVSASIRSAHIPNVHAIAQRLSGAPQSDQCHQQLVEYAKSCVQPGLEYFERQLGSSLKTPLAAFKCVRMFSPQKIYLMQLDTSALGQSLAAVPFLRNAVDSLKTEVPAYLVKAASTSADITLLEWWKRNETALPNWSKAAKKILLYSNFYSASAERVFLYSSPLLEINRRTHFRTISSHP